MDFFRLDDRESLATYLVTIRWGSYFALGSDPALPVWEQIAEHPDCGRFSDAEMMRMNLETSAAMEAWIEILRADYRGEFTRLTERACAYLPLTRQKSDRDRGEPVTLFAEREALAQALAIHTPERVRKAREQCRKNATRTLANCLINARWRRTGPLEDLHAGPRYGSLPLDRRRVTPAEERGLRDHVTSRLGTAMLACYFLAHERQDVTWEERVLCALGVDDAETVVA